MDVLIYLVPIAVGLSFIALLAFLWTLKTGQYDDLEGTAQRVLLEEDESDV